MAVKKFIPGETLGARRLNQLVDALPQPIPGQGQSRGGVGRSGVNVPNTPRATERVFQGIVKPGSKTVLTIGLARDYTDYALTDSIEIHGTTISVIDKSGASEDVTITDDGHVYYEINDARTAATLKFNTSWPPSGFDANKLYHRVGTVEFVTDRITAWHQIELENIVLEEGGTSTGETRWTTISEFSAATATSTSTIALDSDPVLSKYTPIRWRPSASGGTWFYAVVKSTSSSLLTILGMPLTTSQPIGIFQYGRPEMLVSYDVVLPGKYSISGYQQPPMTWRLPGYAYMVHAGAHAYRGSAVVNIEIGGTGSSVLLTGMTMTGSWVDCGDVSIHSSRYITQVDESIKVVVTSGGTVNDEDLTLNMLFVLP